jgi:hypothetical protein
MRTAIMKTKTSLEHELLKRAAKPGLSQSATPASKKSDSGETLDKLKKAGGFMNKVSDRIRAGEEARKAPKLPPVQKDSRWFKRRKPDVNLPLYER